MDVPLVTRRQELMINRVHKTVLAPQAQLIDGTMDIPVMQQRTSSPQCKLLKRRSVIMQRQVPTIQKIQKTVEMPQVQFKDKVVNVPVVMQQQVLDIQKCRKL